MIINREKALQSLCPEAEWKIMEGNITWLKGNGHSEPTSAEIDAEIIRLQTEYDNQEYARKRKAEYPSIEECVHAILDDDLENLQILRQAVKNKFPKENT
jgi:hypothetical protein